MPAQAVPCPATSPSASGSTIVSSPSMRIATDSCTAPTSGWPGSMPLSRMHTRTPAPVAPPHAQSRVTCSGQSRGSAIRSTASAGRLQAGSGSLMAEAYEVLVAPVRERPILLAAGGRAIRRVRRAGVAATGLRLASPSRQNHHLRVGIPADERSAFHHAALDRLLQTRIKDEQVVASRGPAPVVPDAGAARVKAQELRRREELEAHVVGDATTKLGERPEQPIGVPVVGEDAAARIAANELRDGRRLPRRPGRCVPAARPADHVPERDRRDENEDCGSSPTEPRRQTRERKPFERAVEQRRQQDEAAEAEPDDADRKSVV